jgi:DNA-binding HxlR family transcriptional regulator
MVKRTNQTKAACPVARALDAIGDWWTLLIVQNALSGVSRFGEFQRNIGLAKNILSVRLKTLIEHGIFITAPASDGSAYREYILTQKGQALLPVLVALRQWGEDFMFTAQERRSLVDKKKGERRN